MIPTVNSHTNWSHLEEVWLGDCYPAHFYDHLESEVRDVFYEITEKTQADLAVIQRQLKEFGVTVQRPCYHSIDQYVDPNEQLIKPHICPRDYFLVYGNNFYSRPGQDRKPWQTVLDYYQKDPRCRSIDRGDQSPVTGANTVRAGRDIYVDLGYYDCVDTDYVDHLFQDYRLHKLWNGGHIDGCFAVARPGLLITSEYYSDYDRTFPGWERINISEPEFQQYQLKKRSNPDHNGQWYVNQETNGNKKFNEHIIKHAQDWVGDYTETYFEVNCLVLNETNIMMLGNNEGMARELERRGMTVHWAPFRTRTFWDGGLHCITLDIRRRDSMIDLFPERRNQAVFEYTNS